jgi:predicted amidophosphoribosyltransferase
MFTSFLKKIIVRGQALADNDDSVMICPQCKEEYRAGFTLCGSCDINLLSKEEYVSRIAKNTPVKDSSAPFIDFHSDVMGNIKRLHHLMKSHNIDSRYYASSGGGG